MASLLPSLRCEGVGKGWSAYGYKAAAEVIFISFVYNAGGWAYNLIYTYAYNGYNQAEALVAPAVKAYEELCSTSAETGFLNWYRASSDTINQACLSAGRFKEEAIFNVNKALLEARNWILNVVRGVVATMVTPVVYTAGNDVMKRDTKFTMTQKLIMEMFSLRHVIVCKIAEALQFAYRKTSSCSKSLETSDKPSLKL